MATVVPSQYQALINSAAQATGIPEPVVAAQVNDESGFNPNAVSPTGAEGMFQFEPSTYNSIASTAGVQPGTEFNPDDEVKAYEAYMSELLKQEGGSLEKALEAYNAGPGDLTAGQGYATSILSAAGAPASTSVSGGTGSAGQATDTSALGTALNIFGQVINPFDSLKAILGQSATGAVEGDAAAAAESVIGDVTGAAWQSFMQVTGISGVKDFMIRAGLIVLGFVIIIIGLVKLFDVHPVQNAVSFGKTAAKDTAVGAAIL